MVIRWTLSGKCDAVLHPGDIDADDRRGVTIPGRAQRTGDLKYSQWRHGSPALRRAGLNHVVMVPLVQWTPQIGQVRNWTQVPSPAPAFFPGLGYCPGLERPGAAPDWTVQCPYVPLMVSALRPMTVLLTKWPTANESHSTRHAEASSRHHFLRSRAPQRAGYRRCSRLHGQLDRATRSDDMTAAR